MSHYDTIINDSRFRILFIILICALVAVAALVTFAVTHNAPQVHQAFAVAPAIFNRH